MASRASRHLHALKMAHACVELGARVRTVSALTRLPRRTLIRLFFADPQTIPRGRPPDSPEWYHTANVLFRAEASIVGVLYHRMRRARFEPPQALLSAYRHYRGLWDREPRISFDRAFDLASHLDGLWIATTPSFSVVHCPACASEHLAAAGGPSSQAAGCPFCKVLQRFHRDPRVQCSFPAPALADPRQIVLGIDLLLARSSGALDAAEADASGKVALRGRSAAPPAPDAAPDEPDESP